MGSVNPYLSVIGKNIICECVKHFPVPNPHKNNMIIDRPIKINFTYKSHIRTGKPCYAYVNSGVKFNPVPGTTYYISPEVNTDEIKFKLKNKYCQNYEVRFKGGIYGKKLIGECSQMKFEEISHWSGVHGGQRINMFCGCFAICYVEIPHEMANMKFSTV